MLRSLLSAFRPKAPLITVTALDWSSGDFNTDVVGEASYQPAIRAALARATRNDRGYPQLRVALIRQPANKHDRNAVAVFAEKGSIVGFLPRSTASYIAPLLDAAKQPVSCDAIIIGEGKPHLGLVLDLEPPSGEEDE